MSDENNPTVELPASLQLVRRAQEEVARLKAENARLLAIAEAAREWTRIEHDPEEVSMDEAIEICNRLQEVTEQWMNALQTGGEQAASERDQDAEEGGA